MHIPILNLLAVLCQDPIAAEPAGTARADRVELRGGEVLEGRIVLERGNYLEIELAPGAVVGLRTAEIRAVHRGAGMELPAAPAGGLLPLDEWFVLHDAAGRPVGWLHAATTVDAAGQSRVQEEWEFTESGRHFQVTMLEVLDPQSGPVSCYFRERISEEVMGFSPSEPISRQTRVLDERIIEARVEGGLLRVERLAVEGRRSRQLPWPSDGTFPLLARSLSLRREPVGTVTVFDPGQEELRVRTYAAMRLRTVPGEGGPIRVKELTESGPAGDNAVWVDASSRTVRREIAGLALVAVRSTAEAARLAVQSQREFGAAFAGETAGRFGLWRPNPAWDVVAVADASIALGCPLLGGSVVMSLLDHLDTGSNVIAAADAVERWLRLLQPGITVRSRGRVESGGRAGLRLDCMQGGGQGGERTVLHVLPWQGAFVVVRCSAPAEAWSELEADFAFILAHLELEPKAVAQLSGPRPAAPGRAAPAAAGPPATGQPSREMLPRVRVPIEELLPPR